MIESIENLAQIVILCCCVGAALYHGAGDKRTGAWVCVTLFFGSNLLGDLYWQICIFYFGDTPEVSLVPDLSWFSSILFLYLLVKMEIGLEKNEHMTAGGPPVKKNRYYLWKFLPFLGPVFTFGMAVFYMKWGKYVTNLAYALVMGVLLFVAIRGLLAERDESVEGRPVCAMAIVFALLEHATWISTCFPDIPKMDYAYYGCDILMTMSYPVYIPIVMRLSSRQRAVQGGGVR